MKYANFILSLSLVCILIARVVRSESCAINFQGQSGLYLSAESLHTFTHNTTDSVDYAHHTFDFWMRPTDFVSHEQSIFHTGRISTNGLLWAAEFNLKLTIWQKGVSTPSSSVLYVDFWRKSGQDRAWTKTRHYVILASDSYPWVHVEFTPSESEYITINGKNRRLDQYSAHKGSLPHSRFSIGEGFHGVVSDLKVWKNVDFRPKSNLDCNPIRENTLIYFPLHECQGEVFSGYIHGAEGCAIAHGSGLSFSRDSPVEINNVCEQKLTGQCKTATKIPDATSSDESEDNGDNFWDNSLFTNNALTKLGVLVFFIGAFIMLRRRRANNQSPESSRENLNF